MTGTAAVQVSVEILNSTRIVFIKCSSEMDVAALRQEYLEIHVSGWFYWPLKA